MTEADEIEIGSVFKSGSKKQVCFIQGERGHWTVNDAGTLSFITTFSYSLDLKSWLLLQTFDCIVPN